MCIVFFWYELPHIVIFNYYMFQEVLGLLFIFRLSRYSQLLCLMSKIGIAPFHFWLFSLIYYIRGSGILWLVLWRKLPYLALPVIYAEVFGLLITVGLVLLYLQMAGVYSSYYLIFLSSVERFRWFMLMLNLSLLVYCSVFFVYLLIILISLSDLKGSSLQDLFVGYIVLSMPLSVLFWVKFIRLRGISWIFLILLLLMPFSFLSLAFFCLTSLIVVLVRFSSNILFFFCLVIIFWLLF